jgi:hypothetical protein
MKLFILALMVGCIGGCPGTCCSTHKPPAANTATP